MVVVAVALGVGRGLVGGGLVVVVAVAVGGGGVVHWPSCGG